MQFILASIDSIKRRDIPNARNSNELESVTQLKLKNILNDHWIRSNENCRADGGYRLNLTQSIKWLPIQLKTTAKPRSSRIGRVQMKWDLKGHTMLCLLHCISTDHLVVIPGSLAKQVSIDLDAQNKPKNNSTYAKYVVEWSELPHILSKIYQACENNLDSIDWHSSRYSLNLLELQTSDLIMTPVQKKRQIELERAQNRASLLPGLKYERPECDAMPFDVYIDGKRVQDKSPCKISTWAHMSSLHKSNGIKDCTPYSVGDFDFLWLHIANSSFYLVPAKVLLDKGFLTTHMQKGKTSFRVYPEKNGHWTEEYYHSYQEPNLLETVQRILGQI